MQIKAQPKQIEFLTNPADIVIFGGSAGGGKSYALHLIAIQQVSSQTNYVTFFRRTTPEIKRQGALWDESTQLYPYIDAIPKAHTLSWAIPLTESKIEFNHLQHDKTRLEYQGSQIPVMLFDELTHFTAKQFWYMLSRNRLPSGVSGDVKPIIRATCNPDPDSFVAKFVEWYIDQATGYAIPERSGKIRYFIRKNDQVIWGNTKAELVENTSCELIDIKSFSFISSSLTDNPMMLDKDPSYKANLMAQDDVETERLLHGNWKIKQEGEIFKQVKFKSLQEEPGLVGWVDPSYSGKNTTAFCIGCKVEDNYYIKGWVWPDSIVDLYHEIKSCALAHNTGSIIFESNADKGLSAKDFREIYESVETYHESTNKHRKIMGFLYKNWKNVLIDPDSDSAFVSQILSYIEGKEPDDAPDCAASLIRRLSGSALDFGGGSAY